jgi:hypothetical protein
MRSLGLVGLMLVVGGCGEAAPPPEMATQMDQSVAPGDAAGGSCKDNVKNGQETDVDCGGPICPACVEGRMCNGSMDCQSQNCVNNVCAPPVSDVGGQNSDMVMSVPEDMAAPPGSDLSTPLGSDMAGPMGTACVFDDPNSLFDDCIVGP